MATAECERTCEDRNLIAMGENVHNLSIATDGKNNQLRNGEQGNDDTHEEYQTNYKSTSADIGTDRPGGTLTSDKNVCTADGSSTGSHTAYTSSLSHKMCLDHFSGEQQKLCDNSVEQDDPQQQRTMRAEMNNGFSETEQAHTPVTPSEQFDTEVEGNSGFCGKERGYPPGSSSQHADANTETYNGFSTTDRKHERVSSSQQVEAGAKASKEFTEKERDNVHLSSAEEVDTTQTEVDDGFSENDNEQTEGNNEFSREKREHANVTSSEQVSTAIIQAEADSVFSEKEREYAQAPSSAPVDIVTTQPETKNEFTHTEQENMHAPSSKDADSVTDVNDDESNTVELQKKSVIENNVIANANRLTERRTDITTPRDDCQGFSEGTIQSLNTSTEREVDENWDGNVNRAITSSSASSSFVANSVVSSPAIAKSSQNEGKTYREENHSSGKSVLTNTTEKLPEQDTEDTSFVNNEDNAEEQLSPVTKSFSESQQQKATANSPSEALSREYEVCQSIKLSHGGYGTTDQKRSFQRSLKRLDSKLARSNGSLEKSPNDREVNENHSAHTFSRKQCWQLVKIQAPSCGDSATNERDIASELGISINVSPPPRTPSQRLRKKQEPSTTDLKSTSQKVSSGKSPKETRRRHHDNGTTIRNPQKSDTATRSVHSKKQKMMKRMASESKLNEVHIEGDSRRQINPAMSTRVNDISIEALPEVQRQTELEDSHEEVDKSAKSSSKEEAGTNSPSGSSSLAQPSPPQTSAPIRASPRKKRDPKGKMKQKEESHAGFPNHSKGIEGQKQNSSSNDTASPRKTDSFKWTSRKMQATEDDKTEAKKTDRTRKDDHKPKTRQGLARNKQLSEEASSASNHNTATNHETKAEINGDSNRRPHAKPLPKGTKPTKSHESNSTAWRRRDRFQDEIREKPKLSGTTKHAQTKTTVGNDTDASASASNTAQTADCYPQENHIKQQRDTAQKNETKRSRKGCHNLTHKSNKRQGLSRDNQLSEPSTALNHITATNHETNAGNGDSNKRSHAKQQSKGTGGHQRESERGQASKASKSPRRVQTKTTRINKPMPASKVNEVQQDSQPKEKAEATPGKKDPSADSSPRKVGASRK